MNLFFRFAFILTIFVCISCSDIEGNLDDPDASVSNTAADSDSDADDENSEDDEDSDKDEDEESEDDNEESEKEVDEESEEDDEASEKEVDEESEEDSERDADEDEQDDEDPDEKKDEESADADEDSEKDAEEESIDKDEDSDKDADEEDNVDDTEDEDPGEDSADDTDDSGEEATCPNTCVAQGECAAVGGERVQGYTCTDDTPICCDLGNADNDTGADTVEDVDSDTDDNANTDIETDNDTGEVEEGDCVKGSTQGNQVAVIGESFIAQNHGLTRELEALAEAAGSLQPGDHYVDKSVPGTTLGPGGPSPSIPAQYDSAQAENDIKYVVMDGGGNDCMQGGTADPAYAAAETLFQTMQSDGVQKVLYFFYPDPLGSFASMGLKECLDQLRPRMKALCEGLSSPECYFVDLRESWDGHDEYTSDGIHPTTAGDIASAGQIWPVMEANCIAP